MYVYIPVACTTKRQYRILEYHARRLMHPHIYPSGYASARIRNQYLPYEINTYLTKSIESERAHLSKHGLSSYAESRERSEDLSDLYNQLFPALVDAVDGDEEEYTPNDDSDNSNERKSNGKRSKSFTLFDPSVVTEENFIWAACVVDMFSVQVR